MPRARLRLLLVAVFLAAGAVALLLAAPHSPAGLRALVAGAGALAPLLFVGLWIVLTPGMVSGTVLAAEGGLAFGVGTGTAVGVAGATLGGVVAFLIARLAGCNAVEAAAGPRLARVRERVEGRGFVAVLVARMAPGVPATALNYACGLTRIPLRTFAAAIALGGAPRVLAYTALGSSGGDLTSPGVLLGLGLVALLGFAGLAALARRARRGRPAAA